MEDLINIQGQQFYYSTIDQLVEKCAQLEKCALIIDESHFQELVEKGSDLIGSHVDQIIVVSENLNIVFEALKEKDVLLMCATNLESAIRFAILSTALNKEIVCVPKENKQDSSEIIELIVV